MSDPIVYGFPRSTFVNIIRMILTHKDVAYSFHDLEPVMRSVIELQASIEPHRFHRNRRFPRVDCDSLS